MQPSGIQAVNPGASNVQQSCMGNAIAAGCCDGLCNHIPLGTRPYLAKTQ